MLGANAILARFDRGEIDTDAAIALLRENSRRQIGWLDRLLALLA